MYEDYVDTVTGTECDEQATADPRVTTPDVIRIDGETFATLPGSLDEATEQSEVTTRSIGFECASGDWLESTWTGVPLDPLLNAGPIPPETTHVVVEAADGYRACIGVLDLARAMVAYDAVDRPSTDFPRFVSPSIDGPRAVKNLARLRPVKLAPHEDPADYEELSLQED